jgi:hypothetical protein
MALLGIFIPSQPAIVAWLLLWLEYREELLGESTAEANSLTPNQQA